MQTIKYLVKQRRIWAGLFATIAIILPIVGYEGEFDQETATDAFITLMEAVSGVLAIVLPLWSIFKPKKN